MIKGAGKLLSKIYKKHFGNLCFLVKPGCQVGFVNIFCLLMGSLLTLKVAGSAMSGHLNLFYRISQPVLFQSKKKKKRTNIIEKDLQMQIKIYYSK